MLELIRHYLNPLHVYCRLADMGLPKRVCKALCKPYGLAYRLLLCRRRGKKG